MNLHLDPDDQKAVEALLRAGNTLGAVVIVRRATNVGLREALDYLEVLKSQLQLPAPQYDPNDAIYAEVIAIGSYHADLAQYLGYPPGVYANTREGVSVIGYVVSAWGRAEAEGLARCFAIDAWDFNQHHLDSNQFEEEMMWDVLYGTEATADLTRSWEHYTRALSRFAALRAAGFDFYFLIRNTED